uniref:dUTP diphosphatase n=1 Tax=Apteryx owenii TaxID=8824 RepID=A0A8B9PEZ8_APTOW
APCSRESIERPPVLRVQRLRPQAYFPMQAMPRSAGLDLQLPHKEITLEPEGHHLVSMGLAITIPQGYYGHMVPCNSSALREQWGIKTGVLDSNYPEEVKVFCGHTCYNLLCTHIYIYIYIYIYSLGFSCLYTLAV